MHSSISTRIKVHLPRCNTPICTYAFHSYSHTGKYIFPDDDSTKANAWRSNATKICQDHTACMPSLCPGRACGKPRDTLVARPDDRNPEFLPVFRSSPIMMLSARAVWLRGRACIAVSPCCQGVAPIRPSSALRACGSAASSILLGGTMARACFSFVFLTPPLRSRLEIPHPQATKRGQTPWVAPRTSSRTHGARILG